jgi:hypothetical protein
MEGPAFEKEVKALPGMTLTASFSEILQATTVSLGERTDRSVPAGDCGGAATFHSGTTQPASGAARKRPFGRRDVEVPRG